MVIFLFLLYNISIVLYYTKKEIMQMDKEQEVKTDDLNAQVDEVAETTKEVSGETEVTLESQMTTLIELMTSMNEKLDTLTVTPDPEPEPEQEPEPEPETIELSEDELKALDDELQGV